MDQAQEMTVQGLIDHSRLKNILESLLFIARQPLTVADAADAIGVSVGAVSAALEELYQEYEGRGIKMVKVAGGYIMGTAHENAPFIKGLLHKKIETTLTAASLETLSIIAYKQPITKVEIERIRGVLSDGPIETLLNKRLIEEKGRSDGVGRPYLYGTTEEFLRHFGIKDLESLPPLPESLEAQSELFRHALHDQDELN